LIPNIRKRYLIYFLLLFIICFRIIYIISLKSSIKYPKAGIVDKTGCVSTLILKKFNLLFEELYKKIGASVLIIIDKVNQRNIDKVALSNFRAWQLSYNSGGGSIFLLLDIEQQRICLICGEKLEYFFSSENRNKFIKKAIKPYIALRKWEELFQNIYKNLETFLKDSSHLFKPDIERIYEKNLILYLIFIFVLCIIIVIIGLLIGKRCPLCRSRLKVLKEIVRKPTELKNGLLRKEESCVKCGYFIKKEKILPAKKGHKILKKDFK